MNISVNGESRIPPGFRFHPTEEELLSYYLKKKVCNDKIDLDVIFEVDLNKLEPWDIQEKCRIGTTPQNDWYFFSHKDKKYPTGTRTNRATVVGFWKATGRDKAIYGNGRRIGMRKTLVFYQGRAPHGQKSDWIMHEYRLDESSKIHNDTHVTSHVMNGELAQEEGWVVCKIFKKKNNIIKSPRTSMSTTNMTLKLRSNMPDSPSDNDHDNNNNDQGALEQIFQPVGHTNNKSFENRNINRSTLHQLDKFVKLPSLESPNHSTTQQTSYFDQPMHHGNKVVSADHDSDIGLTDWATLDRFLATQINGHNMDNNMTSIFTSINVDLHDHAAVVEIPHLGSSSSISSGIKTHQHYAANGLDSFGCNEVDLWSFTRSTVQIDPFCHLLEADL